MDLFTALIQLEKGMTMTRYFEGDLPHDTSFSVVSKQLIQV